MMENSESYDFSIQKPSRYVKKVLRVMDIYPLLLLGILILRLLSMLPVSMSTSCAKIVEMAYRNLSRSLTLFDEKRTS